MKTLLLKLKAIKIKSSLPLLYAFLFLLLCHNLYQLVIYKNALSGLSAGLIIGLFFSYLAYYPLLQSIQRDRDGKSHLLIEFTHSCIKCRVKVVQDLARDKALIMELEAKIAHFNELYNITNEYIEVDYEENKDKTITPPTS